MKTRPRSLCSVVAGMLLGAGLWAQPPGGGFGSDPAADLLRDARQKTNEGKNDEALAIYNDAILKFPNSVGARIQAGVLLDLLGRYTEARPYFEKAIQIAPTQQAKAQAQRSLAMSYAFEGDCKDAAKYEGLLYQAYVDAKDWFNAGETADELARVCIDSGDLTTAYNWYQKGHEAGMNETSDTQKDLWNFRWEHAQARIAARRGNKEEAEKHVAAAKAILEKGDNPQQAQFFPYLTGYVAFYLGDYRAALDDLQKANQNDPFILVLMAQAYDKLNQHSQAMELYQKAAKSGAHNPPNAYAHPLAKKKLG